MSRELLLILVTIIAFKSVNSVNILFVDNVPSPSHQIWNRPLVLELLSKGYNITYLGADLIKNQQSQNLTQILLEDLYRKTHEDFDLNEFAAYGPLRTLIEFENWCIAVCQAGLESKGLEQLIAYPENHFDFIILDITLGSCFYPIIEKFKFPPTIGLTAFLLPPYISSNFGNVLLPTFLPWYGLPYTAEMTFVERLWNLFFVYADVFLRNVRLFPAENRIGKQFFGKNIQSAAKLERHISLVLSNTNPLLDWPQLLPPHIIPVGGLHTRPSKTLPNDLKKILDDSEGAIIFSLGSNVRSDLLSKETQKEILKVFSQLKETVIWKFESEIKNLPKNVIVRKWLSQNDLLGHPKVKLFIGHGGALSTQEAMFHGVPMLVIPFFADQIINAKLLVHRKLAETVDFHKILSGEFSEKLTKVLTDSM